MDHLAGYAYRPLPYMWRCIQRRLAADAIVFVAFVVAAACSVAAIRRKFSGRRIVGAAKYADRVWLVFAFLISAIPAAISYVEAPAGR